MKGRIALADPATVLKIYYSSPELDSSEIEQLFCGISSATVSKLKRKARALMREQSVGVLGYHAVNTKAAFEAWGIDVAEVERNYRQLKRLGLYKDTDSDEAANG